jgi:cyclopropane-fatty-acyl-phospholipid synthase
MSTRSDPLAAPPLDATHTAARSPSVPGLTLHLPLGPKLRLEGAGAGPAATLVLHRWRALWRLVRRGSEGLLAAYLDGDWDSPDLAALIEWAARNRRRPRRARTLAPVAANDRARSVHNAAHHYDLGNAFFRCWLDPSLSYSAAYFEPGQTSLEAAQRAKHRRLLDLLDPRPGEHLLEIGCGWGAFAQFAAREASLRVTAATLSRAQYEFARAAVAQAGLSDRVEVVLSDYRDLAGRYDHIASIEMFEAVGEADWPVYFDVLRARLKPGGRAALQVITIAEPLFEDYRRRPDFIRTHVFPGGLLPPPSALRRETARAGFRSLGETSFGAHYARTLALWRTRFEAAWPAIEPLGFDERFRRLWRLYLAYCEGGFRAGTVDVVQLALARDPRP